MEDIAQTVAAAIFQERQEPGTRLFNLADDEPAPPQDVLLYAAELIGAPPPPEIPFESAALPAMAASFYAGNKRIRNDKIKRELGVALRYPTYREGLRALLEDETGDFGGEVIPNPVDRFTKTPLILTFSPRGEGTPPRSGCGTPFPLGRGPG